MKDLRTLAGMNEYRYVRHAAFCGAQIAFISEHGKDLNKVVIAEVAADCSLRVLKEMTG